MVDVRDALERLARKQPDGPGRATVDTFEDEVPAGGPTFNQVGRLAMANAGPGTNGSQFFVTVGETPWLNGKHTIFGQVTDGYDVVEAIAKTPVGAQDKPVDDVVIERIDIAEQRDRDPLLRRLNTWGYRPPRPSVSGWGALAGRPAARARDDVHVIEEGQNGRTTVFDVPFEADRNGLTHLPVSLQTHHPLDLVVIDLGTNDLFLPGVNAYHAARGAIKLAEVVLASDAGRADGAPLVLVIVPPPFAPLGQWDQAASPAPRPSLSG